MRNCCVRKEITLWDFRLLFLSWWATASQWSVFWWEIPSSSGSLCLLESGKLVQQSEQQLTVNFLRKLEYNQKKCLRKISQMLMLKYLVFLDTGMVDNLIQAWASITMQVLHAPFTWMTNMRWIGTSNLTNRSRLQAKRKHSIPVRFDITCWPNSQCCAMTGKEGGIEWAQFDFTNVRKRNKPDSFTLFCVQFELNTECFEMNSLNILKSASKCYSFYVMHNIFVLLV